MDLKPIIALWQLSIDQFDTNIAKCGAKWSPEYVAKMRKQQQAIRDCIVELQQPGITAEQVVESIIREAQAILAAQ
jgi:hypothetical protein